jgi:hypothetical protein
MSLSIVKVTTCLYMNFSGSWTLWQLAVGFQRASYAPKSRCPALVDLQRPLAFLSLLKPVFPQAMCPWITSESTGSLHSLQILQSKVTCSHLNSPEASSIPFSGVCLKKMFLSVKIRGHLQEGGPAEGPLSTHYWSFPNPSDLSLSQVHSLHVPRLLSQVPPVLWLH